MTSKLPRVVVPLLAVLGVLALVAGPAAAQAPERLATQVTDPGGVLDDRAGVDAALSDLQRRTGLQLFVVMVDSFDGTPAQQWTDETAALSDLGVVACPCLHNRAHSSLDLALQRDGHDHLRNV